MNRRAMPRPILLPLLLALAACGAQSGPAEQPPLAGATIGGDFTLVDQTGKERRWADFRGRYAVVYFGFTYCPDICPTDMQRTAQGLRKFAAEAPARAAKMQQIFISVDPERDTPQVVGEFAAAFGKDIVALTGTREQVDAAAKAFKVFHSKGEEQGGGAYLVNHSNVTYLFDPEGRPLATLPTDQGADAVAAELARWVR
ncbi:MAG: SCO family protein [Cypionkella sp.]